MQKLCIILGAVLLKLVCTKVDGLDHYPRPYIESQIEGRAVSEMKIGMIRQIQFSKFYSLVKLLKYGANSSVERDLWLVFEGILL